MQKIINDGLADLFSKATPEDKRELIKVFGEAFFNVGMPAIIAAFKDACVKIGEDPTLPFPDGITNRQKATNAFFMLDVLATARRKGVKLDWTNPNQKKWAVWLNNYKSGSGFSVSAALWTDTDADAYGGARLRLLSEQDALDFATEFLPLINDMMNPEY